MCDFFGGILDEAILSIVEQAAGEQEEKDKYGVKSAPLLLSLIAAIKVLQWPVTAYCYFFSQNKELANLRFQRCFMMPH